MEVASPRDLAALLKPGMPANPALAWHPALTGPEQYGGAMEPAQRPDVAGLVQALGGARDAMGGPLADRLMEADAAQRQRWQAGDRAPTPLTEDNIWLADDVAGGLLGPMAMAGIFAGVGAKTANKAALETAQRMASEGADPRAIWRDTGWFQGPEGKWRWEIDDSRSIPTMSANRIAREQDNGRLYAGRAFKHDGLYEAYPELMTAGVRYEQGAPGASWSQDERMIRLRGPALQGTQMPSGSTLLHELQHGAQDIEGFARGGSVRTAEHGRAEALRAAREVQDRIDHIFMGGTDPQGASLDELYAALEPLKQAAESAKSADPYGAYRRLAGEAEARAVQKRMDMTPEQRRATFPLDSYDVPVDELIVRGR